MDWTAAARHLNLGLTELQEVLTMWRPDLESRLEVRVPIATEPLSAELRAEVAEPERGFEAVCLSVTFSRERDRLIAEAAISLDHVEQLVAAQTWIQPEGADLQPWVSAQIDASVAYLTSQVPAVRRWTETAVGAKSLPGRAVVRQRLVDLIEGRRSPEQVAGWAMHYVLHDDDYQGSDPVVWRALLTLGGADLQTSPHEYLHGASDFHRWLAELDAGAAD